MQLQEQATTKANATARNKQLQKQMQLLETSSYKSQCGDSSLRSE
jgi:hypothetical protein